MKTLVICKDLGHAMGLKPRLGRFRWLVGGTFMVTADTPLKVGYVIVARRVPAQEEKDRLPTISFRRRTVKL